MFLYDLYHTSRELGKCSFRSVLYASNNLQTRFSKRENLGDIMLGDFFARKQQKFSNFMNLVPATFAGFYRHFVLRI